MKDTKWFDHWEQKQICPICQAVFTVTDVEPEEFKKHVFECEAEFMKEQAGLGQEND